MGIQNIQNVELTRIKMSNAQPRTQVPPDGIDELAQSLKQDGVLQPIIVRPYQPRKGRKPFYQVVVGSRRFKAAQSIGLKVIPAIVAKLDDLKCFEVALIENLQREDLTIFEEAIALFNLMKTGGYETIDDLAKRVGKSTNFVRDRLKVLQLPEPVQRRVAKGQLTLGQANAISRVKDPDKQTEVADLIARDALTNDEAHALVMKKVTRLSRRLKVGNALSPVPVLERLHALLTALKDSTWSDMGAETHSIIMQIIDALSTDFKQIQNQLRQTKKSGGNVVAVVQAASERVSKAYSTVQLLFYIEETERRVRELSLNSIDPQYRSSVQGALKRLAHVLASRLVRGAVRRKGQ